MRCPLNGLIASSGIIMMLSGTILLILTSFVSKNLMTIAIPSLLFAATCNIIFSNAAAGALTPLDKQAIGAGSALFSCIQIVGPALASALITALPFDYVHILEFSYFLIGAAIIWLLSRIRLCTSPVPTRGL